MNRINFYPTVKNEQGKKLLAQAALDLITDAQCIAVGAGSSVQVFLEELALRISQKSFPECTICAPCFSSWLICKNLSLPVTRTHSTNSPEYLVDGADEVCSNNASLEERGMLKGGGGSLYKEKILFEALSHVPRYILVSADKLSSYPGETGASLTLEIEPEKVTTVWDALSAMPQLQFAMRTGEGLFGPLFTEQGNLLIDIKMEKGSSVQNILASLPEVFCNGFFPLPSHLFIEENNTVRLLRH